MQSPQDLTGRGLLLQGFAKIVVALPQFFEQPHILNGDHCLVGEGFKQLNLSWSEGAHLDATRAQSPTSSPADEEEQ